MSRIIRKELATAAGKFHIPRAITTDREKINRYADLLEACVKGQYKSDEFIDRGKEERLIEGDEGLHQNLYNLLCKLDVEKRNGIWARILKNAFAPIFAGRFDYVVGNPPWVNWESRPRDYRDTTGPIWEKYKLFRQKGYKAKLDGSKDDISILMTYVAHDAYLAAGGKLGFVITQSVFKTKGGGEGFRALSYDRDGQTQTLAPIEVDDFSSFQPFEDAANRTAVMVVGKRNAPVTFPVPYRVWAVRKGQKLSPADDYAIAMPKLECQEFAAEPVDQQDKTSPWMTAKADIVTIIEKIKGKKRIQKSQRRLLRNECSLLATGTQGKRAEALFGQKSCGHWEAQSGASRSASGAGVRISACARA